MTGKASNSGDINDFIKENHRDSVYNSGLQRQQQQGTPQDRGFGTGTQNLDTTSKFKLDTRGGFMKGALGRKSVASSELPVSGIIDMADYHIPRLYVTNIGGNTLKVIIPTLGDGQEIFIRSNGGATTPIQHTAGAGNETTGNIETMAAATYSMVGDDWLEFHYDVTDSKWHQITAGKQNIGGGGGGGEFFGPWTGEHDAGDNNLVQIAELKFNINGTNDGVINAPAGVGMQYDVVNISLNHRFFINSHRHFEINNGNVNVMDGATEFVGFNISSNLVDFNNHRIIALGQLDMTGAVDMNNNEIQDCAILRLRTTGSTSFNSINGTSIGDMEYDLGSSTDTHKFFVGSERLRISSSSITSFNPLIMSGANISSVGSLIFDSTSAIGGSSVGWSGLTGDMFGNVSSGDSYFFRVSGTTEVEIDADGIDIRNGWLEMEERATPTGLSNHVRIYPDDNGAGKTRLMVKFGTGAAQQIAIEP